VVKRLLLVLAACGAQAHPAPKARVSGDDITLYRDVAAVRQQVPVPSTIDIPEGVTPKDVLVLGEATARSMKPGKLTLDGVSGSVVIAYLTDKVTWDAAYTMTTTPARDHSVLRGALAVRNGSGVPLRGELHVVDADLGAARTRMAARLAGTLVGDEADPNQVAAVRDVGPVVLPAGETRVELVAGKPRPMRAVLVFDPVGTKLDNPSAVPLRDVSLGADTPSTKVSESFEIARDQSETTGLPAGPVRLLEREADGTLAVLGESRLFDAQTRRSDLDTIAIGTAEGVTAQRERRELTDDEARHRLTEDFVITIDNARAHPVDVLVREHLYRGQTWALGYWSVPEIKQEGAQAFVMRTHVPAGGKVKILYVVVYTWGT
jgi:hypothetical protein